MSNLPTPLDFTRKPQYSGHLTGWLPNYYVASYLDESGVFFHTVATADDMVGYALLCEDDNAGENVIQHLLSGLCANVCIRKMTESADGK